MTCLAYYWAIFYDPEWGPVSLKLSVWRPSGETLPDYTVIVE